MAIVAALLALSLSAAPAQGDSPFQPTEARPHIMARSEQFVLRSAEGPAYQVSLAWPAGPPPADGYPVVYVLDPSSAFATLVETVRNQEIMFGPVLVVGVGYPADPEGTQRMRDMTPPTDRATLPRDNLGRPWGEIGGANAFLRFIEEVLKPVVESRFRVDRGRQALFGHSLGGLFVLHTLFTRPQAFQTYVAGSPSIWWGAKSILARGRGFVANPPILGPPRRLLITVGGSENQVTPEEEAALVRALRPPDPESLRQRYRAYIAETAPIANSEELVKTLSQTPALQVRHTVFADENHSSVIPAYLSRGASFALMP